MRIHCTDDDSSGIMDLSQLLDRADDLSLNVHTGEFSMATKKSAAAAPAPAAAAPVAPAAPAKKTKGAAAPAPAAAKEEPAAAGPRGVPEGHVGLSAIAESLGISPAAARRKLRASETSFKGEGHGYSWKDGSKEHQAVVKYLTPAKEEATS